ncbi:MAG: 3-dehydroquinate synthase [Anaerolineae bacterium]
MPTLTVTHPTGSYPIFLDAGELSQTGSRLAELGHRGRCAVVTNPTVGHHHAEPLLASLSAAGFQPHRITIPDGEQHKSLDTVADLYDEFIAARLDRRSPVIALGGGVLGDTVGFAAASFLRGVPFVQIPTTLLSMVDASVGGKTGVDLPQGKNLVGAFKQPEMVVLDPNVLQTLPPAELRAGMAEVIKHGILDTTDNLFEQLESRADASPTPYSLLPTPLLQASVSVKIRVVQEDPFEQGRRATLNLGHTFAHAFERLARFDMRHGDAVAMGLVCAARLSARLGLCAGDTTERITALVAATGLPTEPPDFPPEEIWAAMATDKKRVGNTVRFILPRAIGDVDIFSDIEQADVLAVLQK